MCVVSLLFGWIDKEPMMDIVLEVLLYLVKKAKI